MEQHLDSVRGAMLTRTGYENDSDRATVDAGTRWHPLFPLTLERGLTPVLTDYMDLLTGLTHIPGSEQIRDEPYFGLGPPSRCAGWPSLRPAACGACASLARRLRSWRPAIPLSQQDWRRHFGMFWHQLVTAKQRYDPDHILIQGSGIFGSHVSPYYYFMYGIVARTGEPR